MTLTANRTSLGFELVGNLLGLQDNGEYRELTPNTALSRGAMVVLTYNLVAAAAAGAIDVLGVLAAPYTTLTNPTADRTDGLVYTNPYNIYRCTFSDHRDATATGGSTTTLVDTALSTSTDNDWRGAMLYIYSGTNAGSLRTVSGYTGSSDTLTVVKPYPVACDTTSKYIMLGLGAVSGNNVVNIGGFGVDLKSSVLIDANATIASEAGPLIVMPTPLEEIKNLMLRVMIRRHIYQRAA